MSTRLTKVLIFLSMLLTSFTSQSNTYLGNAMLYKTAENPSPKDSALYLLWQDHKNSPENLETVLEHIVESEKKGISFHIAVEQMDPFEEELIRRRVEREKKELPQSLDNALLPRINQLKEKKTLNDTVVEDLEIRKISGIAQTILRANRGFLIADVLNNGDKALLKSFTDYIGMPIEDITYEDVLNEVFALMEMAEKTAEMVRLDDEIYDSLTSKLYTTYQSMVHLIDLIIEFDIDCSRTVMAKIEIPGLPKEVAGCVGIGIETGRKLGFQLDNVTAQLMDVYVLKRAIELLKKGSHKKIMVITGGKHAKDLFDHVHRSKKFADVLSIGSKHSQTFDHKDFDLLPTTQELKSFLETPLYEVFLAKLFLEKKKWEEEGKTRQKRAVSLAMILCETCISAISSLKKTLFPVTGEVSASPVKKN